MKIYAFIIGFVLFLSLIGVAYTGDPLGPGGGQRAGGEGIGDGPNPDPVDDDGESGDPDLDSSTMLSSLSSTMHSLCAEILGLLPIISMLMVVIGGVIYAGGQVMGAETRARANVWATAMIVGAIIGIMIRAVLPTILGSLAGDSTSALGC